jgi:hypothetical protein
MKHVLTAAACLLAAPALAQPNCVNKEAAIYDANGECVGDLISTNPPQVIRYMNGSPYNTSEIGPVGVWLPTGSTPVILDINKFYGIPKIATFVYPTPDCSGPPYLVVDPALPISHAWADWNKDLWVADPSNYETDYQQSYQFGGPYCYHQTAIVNWMPAIEINQTLVSRLVTPFR